MDTGVTSTRDPFGSNMKFKIPSSIHGDTQPLAFETFNDKKLKIEEKYKE
jgi:hypothetical protein